MNKTKIEWVKNPDSTQGHSLNSKTGCLNHTPHGLCLGGLFPCYACKLANGRLRQRYLANKEIAVKDVLPGGEHLYLEALADPFYPRFWPERLRQPYQIKKPSGFFLDDMSDWMGSYWPEEWTRQEIQMMEDNPRHIIYTLTKQPQNLIKWSPFPDNCFVGVTATDNRMFNYALVYLSEIKATIKFVSLEPLLGRIEPVGIGSSILDWLIIGAQTKPNVYPKLEWVEEIVRAADQAGIPVFLKDNLLELVNYQSPETEFAFNKEGYYRQEMPS